MIDYLVVGSGIAGLVFAALMAKSGRRVVILEAHEHAGGYGHTFQLGRSARFNAQLHYVWNCGEGETVHRVLSYLDLEQQVTFERLDPDGFDHMYMPGYSLRIPGDPGLLIQRLADQFPDHQKAIARFIKIVHRVANGLDLVSSRPGPKRLLKDGADGLLALSFFRSSLQNAFDRYGLPRAAQTLLASQWPDFLLPPEQLSFYAWVMLFTGYQRGAYYPTHHFEHVINSLADAVVENSGELLLQHEVTEFLFDGKAVSGVKARDIGSGRDRTFRAREVVCNMDPQRAASMIGWEKFSLMKRRQLSYEYSPSNFMVYCTVSGIDLTKHGFGRWNVFHTGDEDLNLAFHRMYVEHDYSNPSFAITTPGFMTEDESDRPSGQSILEILTVADHSWFEDLWQRDKAAYRRAKREIMEHLFDAIEKHYIPGFREYLAFSTGGTPTTNERFCFSPEGNSYGSNMTPGNIAINRLGTDSSIPGLYFCNASSGYPGFAGTFWTGASLFERLSGKQVLARD